MEEVIVIAFIVVNGNYHISGTYLNFFAIYQMCIGKITIYMVRSMHGVSPYAFIFLDF